MNSAKVYHFIFSRNTSKLAAYARNNNNNNQIISKDSTISTIGAIS